MSNTSPDLVTSDLQPLPVLRKPGYAGHQQPTLRDQPASIAENDYILVAPPEMPIHSRVTRPVPGVNMARDVRASGAVEADDDVRQMMARRLEERQVTRRSIPPRSPATDTLPGTVEGNTVVGETGCDAIGIVPIATLAVAAQQVGNVRPPHKPSYLFTQTVHRIDLVAIVDRIDHEWQPISPKRSDTGSA